MLAEKGREEREGASVGWRCSRERLSSARPSVHLVFVISRVVVADCLSLASSPTLCETSGLVKHSREIGGSFSMHIIRFPDQPG